jgi:DNA-binding protein HU-beta
MAPMKTMKAMKAMKVGGKAMSKGALAMTIATEHEMKPKQVKGLIDSLVTIATAEVKKTGIFTIPGLCRIKTRVKPARKAGKRMMFGEEKTVKAQPAKTVVKAFPVSALKKQI